MAFWSSLLKWLMVGIIIAIFPWSVIILVLYGAMKSGLLKKAMACFRNLTHGSGMLERLVVWWMGRRGELRKCSISVEYYTPNDLSPYILVPDGAGFLCISAVSLDDSSGSPEAYRKAVSDMIKAIGGRGCTVSFIGTTSGGGRFENRFQIVARHTLSADFDFKKAGIEQMKLIEIAKSMACWASPTMKVKIHRGEELLLMPRMVA